MAGPYIGLFYDGATAVPKQCRVNFDGDRLIIGQGELSSEHSWKINDVRLIDEAWHQNESFQLKCGAENDARVELFDVRILSDLKSKNAKLKKDVRTVAPAFTAATVLLTVVGCLWISLPYVSSAVASLAPRSWEEKLGETVADSAISLFSFGDEVKACIAEDGTKALFELVDKIDQNDGADYIYRLRVIDNPTVNAFAAPAGYIVIFSGILDEFENAEELAAVLAHEIGHVTNRHSLEGIIKAVGVSSIASIVTGDVTGSAFGLGIESSLNAQNSQSAEKEADVDGIAFLNSAGITSTGLGSFFARLSKDEGDAQGFLDSHPNSNRRAEYSKSVAKVAAPAMSEAEWQAVQNICSETETLGGFEWPAWMKNLAEKIPKEES